MAYSSLYSDDGAQEVTVHSSSLYPSSGASSGHGWAKNIHKRFAAFSGKVVMVFKCPSPSRRFHSHSLFKTFSTRMSLLVTATVDLLHLPPLASRGRQGFTVSGCGLLLL